MLVPVSPANFSCQVLTSRLAYCKNCFFLWKIRGRTQKTFSCVCESSCEKPNHSNLFSHSAVIDFERQLPSNPSDTCIRSLFFLFFSYSLMESLLLKQNSICNWALLDSETNITPRLSPVLLKLLMGFAAYVTCQQL